MYIIWLSINNPRTIHTIDIIKLIHYIKKTLVLYFDLCFYYFIDGSNNADNDVYCIV